MKQFYQLYVFVMIFVVASCGARQSEQIEFVSVDINTIEKEFEKLEQDYHNRLIAKHDIFNAFITAYPDHSRVPDAWFYAGLIALNNKHYNQANQFFSSAIIGNHTDDFKVRAEFYRGITLSFLGKHDQAITMILANASGAESKEEQSYKLSRLAESYSALKDSENALMMYDQWFSIADETSQAYIVSRIHDIVDMLSLRRLKRIYKKHVHRRSVLAILVGERWAKKLKNNGNIGHARAIKREIDRIRTKIKFTDLTFAPKSAQIPQTVGVMLPLEGHSVRVGYAALSGVALGMNMFESLDSSEAMKDLKTNIETPTKVLDFSQTLSSMAIRNTAAQDVDIDELVASVAAQDRVMGLIGPIDKNNVEQVADQAISMALPVISLDPTGGAYSSPKEGLFHIVIPAHTRIKALAKHAIALGVREFAILGPRIDYAIAADKIFTEAIEAEGGTVVVRSWYEWNQTSFGKNIEEIAAQSWEGLFIPDQASRLELVIPALVSENLVSTTTMETVQKSFEEIKQWEEEKETLEPDDPELEKEILRRMILLSTAEALSPSFVDNTVRYAPGAIFAPGFYAATDDVTIGSFIRSFQDVFGRIPTYYEAYAYDAVSMMRALGQTLNYKDFQTKFQSTIYHGVTGGIQFSSSGHRIDPGILFQIVTDNAKSKHHKIQAIR